MALAKAHNCCGITGMCLKSAWICLRCRSFATSDYIRLLPTLVYHKRLQNKLNSTNDMETDSKWNSARPRFSSCERTMSLATNATSMVSSETNFVNKLYQLCEETEDILEIAKETVNTTYFSDDLREATEAIYDLDGVFQTFLQHPSVGALTVEQLNIRTKIEELKKKRDTLEEESKKLPFCV